MKTNFKKLALMAGISAAMAGGSMSAHAVIQAVPAPAALIPLFSTVGVTNVRIEVPSSVGADAVVNLFGGPNGTASSTVATGLSPSLTGDLTGSTSRIHWFFMDSQSNELANASFPVSANDVVEFSTGEDSCNRYGYGPVPAMGGKDRASVNGTPCESNLPANSTGYLVLINESAYLGGAPLFSFQADAFHTAPGGLVNNIPVFPLSDTADNGAAAPTLGNNVLEDVSGIPAGAPYGGGPVVSPLISGIRVGFGGGKTTFRAVDLPVNGKNTGETYVVWTDRNASTNVVSNAIVTTPSLTGTTLAYNCDEVPLSGPAISLERQLNFVNIGTVQPIYTALQGSGSTVDGYSFVGVAANGAVGTGAGACSATGAAGFANVGGFLRWFIQPNPINVGGLTSGAYQAAVIFRLRNSNFDGYGQFPVDRGTFSSK